MQTQKTASMVNGNHTQRNTRDSETATVYTTTDYFKFKSIEGNRKKNLLHLKRLKESIQEKLLFTVIIINEKFEIIDGQHRFDILSELGLPVNYIICKGYKLNEVHVLNQNAKTWNADDFMNGYCDLGYSEYLLYRDFKDKYKLGHHESTALLLGTKTASLRISGGAFYSGDFKIKSLSSAVKIIEKIFMTSAYYSGYKRRSYIFAMITLLKNKNFSFTEFLQKLKNQPTAMVDCATTEQYISLIEEIYNYRRHQKVNLRFS